MNKSTAELLADQLTKEKFDILGKIANATIGMHIEGTKAMTPEESKKWHEIDAYYDKDNVCKIYSPEDIVRIYSSCQILVTYHVTLAHQLVDQINNMDSIEKIEALEYSYDSLDKKHKANFDAVMEQTQKIAQKVFAQ